MSCIKLPAAEQLILENAGNQIWRSYHSTRMNLESCEIQSVNPFIFKADEQLYFLTSDENVIIPDECEYALLTRKKPRRSEFISQSILFKRWLKHPDFDASTVEDILSSWKGKFKFVKEDEPAGIKGLRPPQLGALYAILSHNENPESRAIIVMPTGTGKTEVMLCTLVANNCAKVLVAVPSDSLRNQLSSKFTSLGLLKELGIIDDTCKNPRVGIMSSKFTSTNDLEDFIDSSNVIVTTMSILAGYSDSLKAILSNKFSHLFVDEAHHSEASTWKSFIDKFAEEKVFLFTATPFRTDEKRLNGKIIFNFSLRNAQQQGYYKRINFLPVRVYERQSADAMIAEKAVAQLLSDTNAGYNHIVMARCRDKKRAEEVFQHYEKYEGVNAVVVYTGVAGLSEKIRAIKNKQYNVVVCVDMLGEGFDLPELKIAAIHDERQSIPITLQFIGRFTRTSYNNLGTPSFVTNIAYPPIKEELDRLYAKDSDWNLLLPTISEGATEKEINFRQFLDGFNNLSDSNIPFQSVYPAMSTVVYINEGNTWNPNNWRNGIPGIDNYGHQYSNYNPHNNTLVIILGRISNVDWGRFDTVQNVVWDMIVVHWDIRPNVNRIFVNSSDPDFKEQNLVHSIFGENNSKITGMEVFRIFHGVNRLAVQNFGGRKGIGKDITFQSFFGRGVQDGLKMLEQGTLIKNNVFGIGYREGEKVSLGCSVKGKMWSYLRGNLDELIGWCRSIGEVVTNPMIDPNTLLEHTLYPISISERPDKVAISIEWHHDMLMHSENTYSIFIDGEVYDLSNCELALPDAQDVTLPLKFSLVTQNSIVEFEMELGESEVDGVVQPYHRIKRIGAMQAHISYGRTTLEPLEDFFQHLTPIFWFADGSQLYQTRYVILREHIPHIPTDNIIEDSWLNVDKKKEAQGIAPYETESIQYYFINKIQNDYDIIYDDDGSGEIADIVAINNHHRYIEISLYHLKYALRGVVSNDIDNLYQVCGQAQKSLNWKYRKGKDFFDHLLRRITKRENGQQCSRLIKGTVDELELLLSSAKWEKEMRFKIFIVQPGFRKSTASDSILQILGNTYHYLHTVGDVELSVYSS